MSTNLYVETAPRLDYNPETGELLWKYDGNMSKRWNNMHAGKRAGSKGKNGRNITIKSGVVVYCLAARRIAWLITYGELPEAVETIDGDPFNDAILNLKASTFGQGNKKAKLRSNNKTGIVGVSYNKDYGGYQAIVKCNGSAKGNSKCFNLLDDAEAWIKLKQIELGFDPDLHGRL